MAKLVGKARYGLELDDKASRKLANFGRAFGATTKRIAKYGALMGTAVVGAAVVGQQALHRLDEVSKQSGISSQYLQVWRNAIDDAGGNVKAFEKGLGKFNRGLGEARKGTGAASVVLRELDIDLRNADGTFRASEPVLREFVTKLEKMPDAADRAANATALFGRSTQDILLVLSGGEGALDAAEEHYKTLGLILEQDVIDRGKRAADAMGLMKRQMANSSNILGGKLGPAIEKASIHMIGLSTAAGSVTDGIASLVMLGVAQIEDFAQAALGAAAWVTEKLGFTDAAKSIRDKSAEGISTWTRDIEHGVVAGWKIAGRAIHEGLIEGDAKQEALLTDFKNSWAKAGADYASG